MYTSFVFWGCSQEFEFRIWHGGCIEKSESSFDVVSCPLLLNKIFSKLTKMQPIGTKLYKSMYSFKLSSSWKTVLLIQTRPAVFSAFSQIGFLKQSPYWAWIWQNGMPTFAALVVNTLHTASAKRAHGLCNSIPKEYWKLGFNADICRRMLQIPLPISTKLWRGNNLKPGREKFSCTWHSSSQTDVAASP